MATGDYSIKVNRVSKKVEMVVSGSFTPEQAERFVNDYHSKLSGINASEFVLEFDCRDLNLVTKEMIPSLEACYGLYKTTGFKKILIGIKKTDAVILKMQLERLGKNVGLTNLEVVQIY